MAELIDQPKEKTKFLTKVLFNTYDCTVARFQLNFLEPWYLSNFKIY